MRHSRWTCGAFVSAVALAFTPSNARADDADTAAPVIQHLSLTSIPAAGPAQIDFTVSDESPLFGVVLHWRHVGESNYRDIEFPDLNAKQFSVRLNVTKDFEFWIEAYDELGNGPALDGSAEKPNVVKVGKAASGTPVATPAPAPSKTTAPPTGGITPPNGMTIPLEGAGVKSEPKSVSVVVDDTPPPPPPTPFFRPIAAGPFVADQTGRFLQARNLPGGRIQVGLDAGLLTGSNFLYPDTSLLGSEANLKAMISPHELVNVGFTSQFRHTSLSYTGSSSPSQSATILNSFTLMGRVALPKLGPVRLGVLGGLEFPGGVSFRDIQTVRADGLVLSPSVTALVTFEQPRFRVHLNAGYKWDNSEAGSFTKNADGKVVGGRASAFNTFALSLSKFDTFSVAAAAEVMIKKAVPYAGYSLEVPIDRLAMASCTNVTGKTCPPPDAISPAKSWQLPQRVVLGLRYEFSQVLAVDGGAEISLTPAGNGLRTDPASTVKTATYLPLDGQVLPPPFLFRIGLLYQFGDLRLPWVKEPTAEKAPEPVRPAQPEAAKAVIKAPEPTAQPAKTEEKKSDAPPPAALTLPAGSLDFEMSDSGSNETKPNKTESTGSPAGQGKQ